MKCTKCGHKKVDVIDSRDSGPASRRRRYKCPACGHRFSTQEKIDVPSLHGVEAQQRVRKWLQ